MKFFYMLFVAFLFLTLPVFAEQMGVLSADEGEGEAVVLVQGSVSDNEKRMESIRRRAKLSARGGLIVESAKRYIGTPYRWAGMSASGFDCSGFVKKVYKENGFDLARMADEQYYKGHKIKKEDLVVGDLVFFTTYTSGVSHVGIYVGDNRFIHASSSRGVVVSSLDDPYYRTRYIGGCRY